MRTLIFLAIAMLFWYVGLPLLSFMTILLYLYVDSAIVSGKGKHP